MRVTLTLSLFSSVLGQVRFPDLWCVGWTDDSLCLSWYTSLPRQSFLSFFFLVFSWSHVFVCHAPSPLPCPHLSLRTTSLSLSHGLTSAPFLTPMLHPLLRHSQIETGTLQEELAESVKFAGEIIEHLKEKVEHDIFIAAYEEVRNDVNSRRFSIFPFFLFFNSSFSP